jgi:hypothetical protein
MWGSVDGIDEIAGDVVVDALSGLRENRHAIVNRDLERRVGSVGAYEFL